MTLLALICCSEISQILYRQIFLILWFLLSWLFSHENILKTNVTMSTNNDKSDKFNFLVAFSPRWLVLALLNLFFFRSNSFFSSFTIFKCLLLQNGFSSLFPRFNFHLRTILKTNDFAKDFLIYIPLRGFQNGSIVFCAVLKIIL